MFARPFPPALLAGAAALSLLAQTAAATPVSLTYTGPSAADPRSVTIDAAPVAWPGSGDWPRSVGAFGFTMSDGSGVLGDFVAWCLDLGRFLATTAQGAQDYTITATPFSNAFGLDAAERARVQDVFDANYATLDLGNGIQVAGFQLALWDALYDGDGSLASGLFQASASTAITNAADGFMAAAAAWDDGRRFNMTFLESSGDPQRQALVTVAPIPLPAGGFLLLTGVGGLVVLRRRKTARAT